MIKKFGVMTIGVAAGLMVAAPLAQAHEADGQGGHHDRSGACSFTGGTGEGSRSGDANGGVAGVSGAAVGGVGGSNVGNIADCSDFLNDNGNGNQVLSHNRLGETDLAGADTPDAGDLGGVPSTPGAPALSAPGTSLPST